MLKTLLILFFVTSVYSADDNTQNHIPTPAKKSITLLQQRAILSAELRRMECDGKSESKNAETIKQQLDEICRQLNKFSSK